VLVPADPGEKWVVCLQKSEMSSPVGSGQWNDWNSHYTCQQSPQAHLGLWATGGVLGWDGICSSPVDGETCISQLYWRQGQMSFVIKPMIGTGCWAWGDDASTYVDAWGCDLTSWAPDSY
jgi:hypothetical protein